MIFTATGTKRSRQGEHYDWHKLYEIGTKSEITPKIVAFQTKHAFQAGADCEEYDCVIRTRPASHEETTHYITEIEKRLPSVRVKEEADQMKSLISVANEYLSTLSTEKTVD